MIKILKDDAMAQGYKNKNGTKKNRDIDNLTSEIGVRWRDFLAFANKKEVKTWQGVSVAAFVVGVAISVIFLTDFGFQSRSGAAGSSASLKIIASSPSVSIGDSFSADIVLNTDSADVVAARAIISYDPQYFSLSSWDTSGSVFSNSNRCIFQDKPCEIVNNDSNSGMFSLTLAKPTPGVNVSEGKMAKLSFKSLKSTQTGGSSIKIVYASYGDLSDSDVILNDDAGTDILSSVSGTAISVKPPVCTDFTYSSWENCQPDGTQTRTIISSSPSGCEGGSPVLIQSCVYTASICRKFTYSSWSECDLSTNTQTRTIISSSPAGCTGGKPVVQQVCKGSGVVKKK